VVAVLGLVTIATRGCIVPPRGVAAARVGSRGWPHAIAGRQGLVVIDRSGGSAERFGTVARAGALAIGGPHRGLTVTIATAPPAATATAPPPPPPRPGIAILVAFAGRFPPRRASGGIIVVAVLAIIAAELVADLRAKTVTRSGIVAFVTIAVLEHVGPTAWGEIGLPARPGSPLRRILATTAAATTATTSSTPAPALALAARFVAGWPDAPATIGACVRSALNPGLAIMVNAALAVFAAVLEVFRTRPRNGFAARCGRCFGGRAARAEGKLVFFAVDSAADGLGRTPRCGLG
jgi:hypothetical protein